MLKPSPYTPLTTLKLGEMLRDVLPPGVLNVVCGGDELGAWMTEHPIPRKISFTGSVATGKKVAAVAARDLKRVTLELGGNDAAIVLDDVDPAVIVEPLFWAAFANSGQVCAAIKRVYVHEGSTTTSSTGSPSGRQVREGGRRHRARNRARPDQQPAAVRARLRSRRGRRRRRARRRPAAPRSTGPATSSSRRSSPALSDGARLVDEEQFGPALPIIAYRDVDDAVERANATHFGLGGSVWGADADRAAAVASRLECGTAWVNKHLAGGPSQPFGGAEVVRDRRRERAVGLQQLHRPPGPLRGQRSVSRAC